MVSRLGCKVADGHITFASLFQVTFTPDSEGQPETSLQRTKENQDLKDFRLDQDVQVLVG